VHELTIRLGDVTTLPWASGEPLSTEVGEPVEACLIGDDPCEPTHPTLGIGTEGEEMGLRAVTSTTSHFVLTDPNQAAESICGVAAAPDVSLDRQRMTGVEPVTTCLASGPKLCRLTFRAMPCP